MKIIDVLNEFKESPRKNFGGRKLEDFIWEKFCDGVGINFDEDYKIPDSNARLAIYWKYHNSGLKSSYDKKFLSVKVGMNSIPLDDRKVWDLKKFEPIFKNAIGPAIHDYYNDN
jgi:hypothetical protein